MTINIEDIFIGAMITVAVAFAGFVYLGIGAVMASVLGLDGLAYYGAIFAWPFIAFALWMAFIIAGGLLITLIRAIRGVL